MSTGGMKRRVVRDLAEIDRQVTATALVVLSPVAAREVQAHRVHVTASGSAWWTARGRIVRQCRILTFVSSWMGGEGLGRTRRAGRRRCRSRATCPT